MRYLTPALASVGLFILSTMYFSTRASTYLSMAFQTFPTPFLLILLMVHDFDFSTDSSIFSDFSMYFSTDFSTFLDFSYTYSDFSNTLSNFSNIFLDFYNTFSDFYNTITDFFNTFSDLSHTFSDFSSTVSVNRLFIILLYLTLFNCLAWRAV